MNKIIVGIIAVVFIIGGSWMFFSHTAKSTEPAQATTSATPVANSDYHDNIYLNKLGADGTAYMTDFAGVTLYTYDNDRPGVSNCTGTCAQTWPPYTSGATAQGQFPANISVITRADGTQQFAWKGMPLYYYSKDAKAGDVNGDGFGGVWHVVGL